MDNTLHLSPWPNAINDWTFAEVHLPKAFHSDQGFQSTITSLKTPPMNVRQQVGMVLGNVSVGGVWSQTNWDLIWTRPNSVVLVPVWDFPNKVGPLGLRVEHGYGENRGMYATVLQVQVAVRGSQTCEHTAPVAAVSQVCDQLSCLLAVPHAMPGHPCLHATRPAIPYATPISLAEHPE